jgi:hydrophobic/amphiphilic exporter-1 (mainly G- bacteria), HAE1 family
MNQLAALCVRRPVFATVLILVLVVFGIFGYLKLGLDRYPKVDFPIITVTTRQPGSAPLEIEREITDKIEEAVNTINGIDELRSVSSEGISQVFVTFVLEKDVDVAAQDVRDKVNRILPELPRDIDQPTVEKLDPDATPILTIAVSAPPPATIRDITEYCDKVLRRRLETVNGVGQVMLVGGQARQINVNLDPMKLRAHRLTVVDVARALESQNLQMPSGSMKVGPEEYTLRTLGRVQSMKEMDAITVANRDGRTITIGDLGHSEDSTEEAQSASVYGEGHNDTPCVLLNIRKQSGTNTVEVANLLKERLEALRSTMPKGYEVQIARDQSIFIQTAVETVEEHLLIGGGLAAIIVFFFLANVRATIIAALAIPTSIIAAFAIINYMGFTLNSLTLLALTLSVGIVIDDAIVVMENIFRFIEEKKYTPYEAAIAATGEIALAVMAITLSLVAVFLPIAMMEGIVGRFLKSFGVTMAATIIISMLVSFTLTPMLAARWFKKPKEEDDSSPLPLGEGQGVRAGGDGKHSVLTASQSDGKHEALTLTLSQRGRGQKKAPHAHGSKEQGFYHAIESVYMVMLRFSLRHRWLIVLATAGCMATLPLLFRVLPKNFIPDEDSSEFQISIQAPEGTTLEKTLVRVAQLARDVRTLDGVRYTTASVADTEQRNPYQGTVYVRLVNIADRTYGQLEMMQFVRENVLTKPEFADLRPSVTPVSFISGGGMSAASVQYMIGGPDIDKLEQSAKAVMGELCKVPGVVDVDSSLSTGKPEYGIQPDRPKAAQLDVSIADISNALRLLVAGDKVSDYTDRGEQYEVHVRAFPEARNRLEELKMATVPSSRFGTIPLEDVVRFERGKGPAQINRVGRTRQVTISANLKPGTSEQAVLDAINETTKALNMGPEYTTGLLGKSKEMAKAFRAFFWAFVLAFVFVYLCIAAQFESWLHPITILLSLPLTLPFALLSLFLFRQSINIFSLLGILVLFAVVKKNSILQIDHANQLREGGMPKFDAIMQANRDRLRPILMTTVAFVAGMIPTLISNAEGSAVNKAISGVIVGGQTLSLLLTLLAVPVAYSLFDDLGAWLGRLFGRRPVEVAAAEPRRRTPGDSPDSSEETVSLSLNGETLVVRREASHEPAAEAPIRP